jgi:hypothetical protein
MADKRKESTWFTASILFLVVYCVFLFLFRAALVNIETENNNVLKPEVGQIIVIGFLILLYHFAFLGIYVFSLLGQWQNRSALMISILITGGLFYGFNKWYHLVVNNPFLSFNNYKTLPWYAQESTKFLIANAPLVLFFATVFVLRTRAMVIKKDERSVL